MYELEVYFMEAQKYANIEYGEYYWLVEIYQGVEISAYNYRNSSIIYL
ncbi:MAG TPA: hypothetical protein PK908_08080 [Bacteroidales bacterium]|nr:hypothetical protein [Bacteroidales bacterium]